MSILFEKVLFGGKRRKSTDKDTLMYGGKFGIIAKNHIHTIAIKRRKFAKNRIMSKSQKADHVTDRPFVVSGICG